ncbi:unnamed protein product [Cylicocyclus nassatus]|uniref:Uncharacterized protein n=1 Tax=Cylicocyclus nassatus TaxID=53992 RepID=A0AA36M614_CYLNA|nr:unnamed protein product [Cylicocyclus nassatus]
MEALSITSTTIHSTIGIFGIFAKVLLAFAVVRKTPANMTTYSNDLLSSLVSVTVQQRIIPEGFGLFYISFGPCRYLDTVLCYIATVTGYGVCCTRFGIDIV